VALKQVPQMFQHHLLSRNLLEANASLKPVGEGDSKVYVDECRTSSSSPCLAYRVSELWADKLLAPKAVSSYIQKMCLALQAKERSKQAHALL
jgi:hypothetical protein